VKKVDLMIAGVQKSGTTALFRYFLGHPDLTGASVKETHFFDDETTVDWSAPDYDRYHKFFPPEKENTLWFEATPIYIYWPRSLERIRDYNPDIRLIFLFRDPIERAWSHWCMQYARGIETLDFQSAIRYGRSRLRSHVATPREWRVFSYVERGFYADQVARVRSLFSREQVLFLPSQCLLRDPDCTLRRITTFLGISPFRSVQAEKVNVRAKVPYPSICRPDDIAYLREIYAAGLSRFETLTDIDVSGWLTRSGEQSLNAHD
jgi:Sulfotransferase domain